LTELGFYSGPIDGRYTQEVVDAVKALQRSVGAPETGVLDVATLRAAFAKGEASVPTTTAPSATDAPTTEAPTTEGPATTAPATTTAPTSPPTTVPPATLLSTLQADPQFSKLVGLIYYAGLQGALSTHDASTLFAPTNDAFAAADQAVIDGIIADPTKLTQMLKHHLVPGSAVKSSELTNDQKLTDANGGTLTITTPPPAVDGAAITGPDIAAGASIIHAIAAVILAT